MRAGEDQRGFVVSGIALMLVLPAMLLAASCLAMVGLGGEALSLQGTTDKVFYTGWDIERVIRETWEENLLFDNEPNANATFVELRENYRATTGLLVDITPDWMLWIHVENNGAYHYPGTRYCKVERIGPENWRYHFEDLDEAAGETPDWDYDEPILRVEKIGENLRITFEVYNGGYRTDVYYSGTLLWDSVGSDNIGISTEVPSTVQLIASSTVRDARETALYSSVVELG